MVTEGFLARVVRIIVWGVAAVLVALALLAPLKLVAAFWADLRFPA